MLALVSEGASGYLFGEAADKGSIVQQPAPVLDGIAGQPHAAGKKDWSRGRIFKLAKMHHNAAVIKVALRLPNSRHCLENSQLFREGVACWRTRSGPHESINVRQFLV